MDDPYPEARRHARHDSTDHRRAVENRRRERRGPSAQRVGDALSTVASHDVPGTPPVSELKVLEHVHQSEWSVDNRTVKSFKVTDGRPMHGALRSDDHIGRYQVVLPFREVDREAVEGDVCPECGHDTALYTYHANHHIAGSESIICRRCEAEAWGEEWG